MSYVLQQFREQCENVLGEALKKAFPDYADNIPRLTVPSNFEFGELSSSAPHEIARKIGHSPHEIALKISDAIDLKHTAIIEKVEEISGYLNFKLNYSIAGGMILRGDAGRQ